MRSMGTSMVQLFIVSPAYERILHAILHEAGAGATLLPIERGYTRAESKGLLCVIPKRKLWDVRQLILLHDPEAF